MLVAELSVDGYKASWGVCGGPAREAPVRVHPQRAAGSAEVIVGSSPKHAGKLPHSDELRDVGREGKEMGWTGRQRRGARYRSGEGIAKRRPGQGGSGKQVVLGQPRVTEDFFPGASEVAPGPH